MPKTHQITGEPSNPWVTLIEPQPTLVDIHRQSPYWFWHWSIPGYPADIPPVSVKWRPGFFDDAVADIVRGSPCQPGDVLEFTSSFRALGYLVFDTQRRTVTRVTAEQREQFVWVVETEDIT